jgi:DNA-binding CsgD family transcriptional regulator
VLSLLEHFDGLGCLVRDADLRVVWCNRAYVRMCGRPASEIHGTRLEDFLPKAAAEERAALLRSAIAGGRPVSYYQFGADKRLQCGALPIDAESFGHAGVLATVQEAPVGSTLQSDEPLKVLCTPCMDALAVLSPSELRALYHIASGRSTAEIAQRLCRATKTVEKHIESIHRKLGTSSRAAIVRLATERGIQAFAESEWDEIIEGSKRVRRSRR